MSNSFKNEACLILVAHPDDEMLGCGGTIARHIAQGDSVHVIILTNGVGARSGAADGRERGAAARKAMGMLGIDLKNVCHLDFPDNAMDRIARLDVIREIEPVVQGINPTKIYTHHPNDLNIDHRLAFDVVMTMFRPQPGCSVREILTFEVLSSTDWAGDSLGPGFKPNYYIDISHYISLKLEAARAYHMEIINFPHARSYEMIESLARFRGGQVGFHAAEAFRVERILR